MIVNESSFDNNLSRISYLYEATKDKINNVICSVHGENQQDLIQALDMLREIRDIAAVNLKANHEIKDN